MRVREKRGTQRGRQAESQHMGLVVINQQCLAGKYAFTLRKQCDKKQRAEDSGATGNFVTLPTRCNSHGMAAGGRGAWTLSAAGIECATDHAL